MKYAGMTQQRVTTSSGKSLSRKALQERKLQEANHPRNQLRDNASKKVPNIGADKPQEKSGNVPTQRRDFVAPSYLRALNKKHIPQSIQSSSVKPEDVTGDLDLYDISTRTYSRIAKLRPPSEMELLAIDEYIKCNLCLREPPSFLHQIWTSGKISYLSFLMSSKSGGTLYTKLAPGQMLGNDITHYGIMRNLFFKGDKATPLGMKLERFKKRSILPTF